MDRYTPSPICLTDCDQYTFSLPETYLPLISHGWDIALQISGMVFWAIIFIAICGCVVEWFDGVNAAVSTLRKQERIKRRKKNV